MTQQQAHLVMQQVNLLVVHSVHISRHNEEVQQCVYVVKAVTVFLNPALNAKRSKDTFASATANSRSSPVGHAPFSQTVIVVSLAGGAGTSISISRPGAS
jgi:hypothetical protein